VSHFGSVAMVTEHDIFAKNYMPPAAHMTGFLSTPHCARFSGLLLHFLTYACGSIDIFQEIPYCIDRNSLPTDAFHSPHSPLVQSCCTHLKSQIIKPFAQVAFFQADVAARRIKVFDGNDLIPVLRIEDLTVPIVVKVRRT
jgi:hypothetical protein